MEAIEASWASRCELCEGTIEEGDRIVLTDDGDWVHERCAEDAG